MEVAIGNSWSYWVKIAVILGTIKAAAELKLKINLIGVIPTVESVIGSKAFKPQDVFKSYSGKTVEIKRTLIIKNTSFYGCFFQNNIINSRAKATNVIFDKVSLKNYNFLWI